MVYPKYPFNVVVEIMEQDITTIDSIIENVKITLNNYFAS